MVLESVRLEVSFWILV